MLVWCNEPVERKCGSYSQVFRQSLFYGKDFLMGGFVIDDESTACQDGKLPVYSNIGWVGAVNFRKVFLYRAG